MNGSIKEQSKTNTGTKQRQTLCLKKEGEEENQKGNYTKNKEILNNSTKLNNSYYEI